MQAYRKSKNLVLLSPTGSGKTLAYLLPLLETVSSVRLRSGAEQETIRTDEEAVQAMVIVPSRELALQTVQVVRQSGTSVRATAVYGGRPAMEEHQTLRGMHPQIVVGTPGRLLDHLTKRNIDPTGIHTLIIDEFDKCLELGFREEMTQVFQHLGQVERRVLLSATDNPEITRFLPEYTRLDYLDGEKNVSERIAQYAVKSPVKDKLETLKQLLLAMGSDTSLVFVGYRESVERVAHFLRSEGFHISALHGGMEQKDRERQLFRFVGGCTNILVSTDLASRGLDIPELNNVIHYHLPLNEQVFIHRNGRTARWDREGRVFVILGPEERLSEWMPEMDIIKPEVFGSKNPGIASTETSTQAIAQQIPLPRWETLYIGKGKREKLSRGDIAGFLMKVGGLEKEEVGRIDVRDHYSYASVARNRFEETLIRLRGQKIKGMKTLFERTR